VTTSRAPREGDLAVLAALRNDVPTQYALLASPRPNTLDDVRAWVVRRGTTRRRSLRWSPTRTTRRSASHRSSRSTSAAATVPSGSRSRPSIRGRGHGRAAIDHVLAAARADGRLDKLVLHVATDNAGAWSLYRTVGFRDVGVHRRHYHGPDGWHDVAVMERFLAETP